MNHVQKMKELIKKIHEADAAYYQKDTAIMTDLEYDKLVAELTMLERATGIHFADSPIGRVPSDEKEGLETVTHSKPMLSCNKTKDTEDFATFAAANDIVLSWKMDGLTLVPRYEKGRFQQAITRGSDGLVGEDVTHTVKEMRNVPHAVPCKDSFEVRGEGVLSWEDYNILSRLHNNTSHPRAVAAGAVRSLTPDLAKLIHMDFIAFELIKDDAPATKMEQLAFLKANNFKVVEHVHIPCSDGSIALYEQLATWTPEGFAYPVDGLVAEYDDIAFGKSLGATAHHEKCRLALKWKDEVKDTVFRGVDLITTRTGVVSIVALFDDVILDGTRIHRANLHNLATFESYQFGVGDIIRVYKANMIIPQIAENVTRSGGYELPAFCPCCGTRLTVKFSSGGTKQLYCPNEDCIARNAQKIARFCDKKAMNIRGLSTATLEKMMAYGWIRGFKDLYHLHLHEDDIIHAPEFGVERYHNIQSAIRQSRRCFMRQFLTGLGIRLLGPEAAGTLHQYYFGSMEKFVQDLQEGFHFSHIAGISPAVERSLHEWYNTAGNKTMLYALMNELIFMGVEKPAEKKDNPFFDSLIAVTGTFINFTREGILELLTSLGARTTEQVSCETQFLIYGTMPGSTKVGAAITNGVNMISEKTFAEMLEKANAS